MIAMGAASVAGLTGRQVDVAIGTSSPVVVEKWHGRSRARSATTLRESAEALRPLLDGERSDFTGSTVSSKGYRLRLPSPRSRLSVAAFGPSAVQTAAAAGAMVLNLITPASAERLIAQARAINPATFVTAWATAAVDPDREAIDRIRQAVVGYLPAPGYGEMFAEAGFADVVAFARTRPHPRELLAAVPDELVAAVAVLGDVDAVRAGLSAYAAAGVDEVALLPVSTERDPGGAATLKALSV